MMATKAKFDVGILNGSYNCKFAVMLLFVGLITIQTGDSISKYNSDFPLLTKLRLRRKYAGFADYRDSQNLELRGGCSAVRHCTQLDFSFSSRGSHSLRASDQRKTTISVLSSAVSSLHSSESEDRDASDHNLELFDEGDYDEITDESLERIDINSVSDGSDQAFGETAKMMKVTERLCAEDNLRNIVDLIAKSKRIVVVTGAGISASCGIPTFRGHGEFYDRVARKFGLPDGQAIMDIEFFKRDPRPFYEVADLLYPFNCKPSPTHQFIAALERANRLLRHYTQNIDTLERVAGIKRVVYCHGSFQSFTCTSCGLQRNGTAMKQFLQDREVPLCSRCHPEKSESGALLRSNPIDREGTFSLAHKQEWRGVMKPDIVFFRENLPDEFYSTSASDVEEADLLIVMGTSLSVAPVSYLPLLFNRVQSIFINAEEVPAFGGSFDYFVQGPCDAAVYSLLRQGLSPLLQMDVISNGIAESAKHQQSRSSGTQTHKEDREELHCVDAELLSVKGSHLASGSTVLQNLAFPSASVISSASLSSRSSSPSMTDDSQDFSNTDGRLRNEQLLGDHASSTEPVVTFSAICSQDGSSQRISKGKRSHANSAGSHAYARDPTEKLRGRNGSSKGSSGRLDIRRVQDTSSRLESAETEECSWIWEDHVPEGRELLHEATAAVS